MAEGIERPSRPGNQQESRTTTGAGGFTEGRVGREEAEFEV